MLRITSHWKCVCAALDSPENTQETLEELTAVIYVEVRDESGKKTKKS